ncbi:MAG: endonuclease III, partial [Betaproteobacteria bacterium]|nr:endonuclease III [Betaproteobacteria bacterium]
KDVLAVEMKLLRFIEPEFLRDAHHWLILHGRYVCKARKPDCPVCRVADLCDMKNKTKPDRTVQQPKKTLKSTIS